MNNNKIQNAFNYYLDCFNENGSPGAAVEIAKMIRDGKIKCTPRNDGKIIYLPSKFSGKCCKCNSFYLPGDFIFCQNSKGWHLDCASEEEKMGCDFYQRTLKRNSEPESKETF
jgi:hypothetical protein